MNKKNLVLLAVVVILSLFSLTVLAQSEKVVPPDTFPGKSAPSDSELVNSGTAEGGDLGLELPAELESVLGNIQPLLLKLSFLIGGLFGLYIILILVRIHYERKQIRLLRDIRYNLDQLNLSQGINCSQQRPGFFKRFFSWFKKSPSEEIGLVEEDSGRKKKKK